MKVPDVRYAMTGDDVRIAYQVFGSGPPTVYVPPFFHHLEGMWEQELHTRVFERMAPHITILLVEPRGTVNTGDAGGEKTAPVGLWA